MSNPVGSIRTGAVRHAPPQQGKLDTHTHTHTHTNTHICMDNTCHQQHTHTHTQILCKQSTWLVHDRSVIWMHSHHSPVQPQPPESIGAAVHTAVDDHGMVPMQSSSFVAAVAMETRIVHPMTEPSLLVPILIVDSVQYVSVPWHRMQRTTQFPSWQRQK